MSSLLEQWKQQDAGIIRLHEDAVGAQQQVDTSAPVLPDIAPAADDDGAPPLRLALEAASHLNAQGVSFARQMSHRLGIPEGWILEAPERAQQEATARTLEQSPKLVQWATQDRQHAALARDDAQGLAGMFEAVTGFLGENQAAISGAWDTGKLHMPYADLGNRYADGDDSALHELTIMRKRMQADTESRTTLAGRMGLTTAIEQLPRIFGQLPTQAAQAGMGAMGAAGIALLAGNAGPQAAFPEEVITVPAAAAIGGRIGWLTATATESFRAERGSFVADLAQEKDANGEPLPREVLSVAGAVYATLAAAVETGAEALFLRLLKPLGATESMGREGFKPLLRSAVKRAAFDQNVRGALLNIGSRIGINGVAEGVEEVVQDAAAILTESGAKATAENMADQYYPGNAVLTGEHANRLGQAFTGGMTAGVWLGGGPIALSGMAQVRLASKAQQFSQGHRDLHARVEETKTKHIAPDDLQNALVHAGLNQTVALPADAVLELYQGGTDLMTPMGWTEESIRQAADMGQELNVSVARLHTRLDPSGFDAASSIMRATVQDTTVQEAETLNEDLPLDMRAAMEQFDADAHERSAIERETERLRTELTQTVKSVPRLTGQISASADPQTSVRQVVEDNLTLLTRRAQVLTRMGIPVSASLARINVQGLTRDEQGRLVTPVRKQQNDRLVQEKMIARARRSGPIASILTGRLNRQEIRNDPAWGPDMVRAIEQRYGRGIFATKKKQSKHPGNDTLVRELSDPGLLPHDATLDDMIHYLAYGASDEGGALLQADTPDTVAVRSDALGVPEGSNIKAYQKAAREVYRELQKAPAHRDDLGDIRFTGDGFRKMKQAGADPIKWKMVPRLKDIIESATYIRRRDLSKDRKDDIVAFHWLEANVEMDGQSLRVGFHIAEDSKGNKFYNVNHDLEGFKARKQKEALAGHLENNRGPQTELHQDANHPVDNTIALESDTVNLHILNHGDKAKARASVTPDSDGNYLIQLFSGADLSSLAHESAHIFFLEMERLEREGVADAAMLADLATLRDWTAALDDDMALKESYDRSLNPSMHSTAFAALSDSQKQSIRLRAKQEMLARGFERYLLDGTAPTQRLEGVFARFCRWLTQIYRDALDLHVDLTDEVRDVFDRMLASEQEVRTTAEAANVRDEAASVLNALGVMGAQRAELEGLIAEAREKAELSMRRARDQGKRERYAAWRGEVAEQVKGEQVYQARAAINTTPLDLDYLNDTYGEALAKSLTRKMAGTVVSGGAQPELVAAEHGYDTAAEMIRAVITAPNEKQRARELMKARQAEHDAQFSAEDFLFEQEQLAEQQERIAAALSDKIDTILAEIRYRREVDGATLDGQEVTPTQEDYEDFGPRTRWRAGRAQLRAQAQSALDARPMHEQIEPEAFRRAASRWLNAERRAMLRNDFRAALKANYKARINIELARQSATRRDVVSTVRDKAIAFLRSRKTDPAARFAVLLLARNIDLIKLDRNMLANAADKNAADIEAWISRMCDEDLMQQEDIPSTLFGIAAPWRTMDWTQWSPFVEAITRVIHVERQSRTIQTEQGRTALAERIAELVANIRAHSAVRTDADPFHQRNSFSHYVEKYAKSGLTAQTITMLLDGDTLGPSFKAIMRPINKATWAQADRMKQEKKALRELFALYSRRELVDMKSKRILVPALNRGITKEQALMVALNSGNASNLERLISGMQIDRDQHQAIIDMLDARDVEFVQQVWNYFETFRKESFDLEESISGVRPEAIAPHPLMTRHRELSGGYFPVVYDRDKSVKPIDEGKIGTQTGGMFPVVDHGSMKQRTQKGLGTPLTLRLDVIPEHIVRTVHMLSFRRPIIEVAKILRNKDVNAAIQETAGVETAKALDGWLRHVAGERPASTGWSKAASWARTNVSLFTMGFKISTMLAQVTGLLATQAEIGTSWAMRGVVDTYLSGQSPLAVFREVAGLSGMMRHRIKSANREIYEASTNRMHTGSTSRLWDPVVRADGWMKEHAFVPMSFVQMVFCDLPTWKGAFAKAMTENSGDMDAAIEYADSVVERTQVGGAEKDLASIMRGSEMGKLMTVYFSYFNALYNIFYRRTAMVGNKRDAASGYRMAMTAMLLWVVEPVVSGLLRGDGPDEEEPDGEDWLCWGARQAALAPFNMLVGVRDIASSVDGYLSGYGSTYRFSPVVGAAGSVIKAGLDMGDALLDDGDSKKAAISGAKALGQTVAGGYLNAQNLLIMQAFWDWLDETTPELEWAQMIRRKKK